MIKIYIPEYYFNARSYVIDTLFTEIGTNLEYEVIKYTKTNIIIYFDNDVSLVLKDSFFVNIPPDYDFKDDRYMPTKIEFLKKVLDTNLKHEIPVFYGSTDVDYTQNSEGKVVIYCGVDVIAMCFFCLSRWEELRLEGNLDRHNRFTENKLFTVRNKIQHIPIVEYCLELIIELFKHGKENLLILKQAENPFVLSCDVDHVRYFKSSKQVVKKIVGDLLKRFDINSFLLDSKLLLKKKIGEEDPFNTFARYMKYDRNMLVEFNILVGNKDLHDFPFKNKMFYLNKLREEVTTSKIKLGFHFGYQAVNCQEEWFEQYQTFLNLVNLKKGSFGGRAHFLRLSLPTTFYFLEKKNLLFDSSFGFVDTFGFRCGTCHEFTLYDVTKQRRLNLKERPFALMDSSFLNLKKEVDVKKIMKDLQRIVTEVKGSFIFIWHNSSHDLPPWCKYKKQIINFLDNL